MKQTKHAVKETTAFLFLLTLLMRCFTLVILFSIQDETKGVVYATGHVPTPTLTYINSFHITGAFNASVDSNSTVQLRHDAAITHINPNILNPHNMNITSNSVQSFSQQIGNWDLLTEQEQNNIVLNYGLPWDNKNVPILYVDVFNDQTEKSRFLAVRNQSGTIQFKLIVMKANIMKSSSSTTDAEEHGKTIIHEYGHNVRLNHTGQTNLMADKHHIESNDLSISIAEVDELPGGYTFPVSANRNQVLQFQVWDGWP